MILCQANHYLDHSKRMLLAYRFVTGAVANIKRVLRYYQNRGKSIQNSMQAIEELEQTLDSCKDTTELMALEGNIRNH